MRFEIKDVPDELPVGRHPSRVENYYTDDKGEIVIPIVYDPTKRVQDSLLPIIKHVDGCPEIVCACGSVHHS